MHLHPPSHNVQWIGAPLGHYTRDRTARKPRGCGFCRTDVWTQPLYKDLLQGLEGHEAKAGVWHDSKQGWSKPFPKREETLLLNDVGEANRVAWVLRAHVPMCRHAGSHQFQRVGQACGSGPRHSARQEASRDQCGCRLGFPFICWVDLAEPLVIDIEPCEAGGREGNDSHQSCAMATPHSADTRIPVDCKNGAEAFPPSELPVRVCLIQNLHAVARSNDGLGASTSNSTRYQVLQEGGLRLSLSRLRPMGWDWLFTAHFRPISPSCCNFLLDLEALEDVLQHIIGAESNCRRQRPLYQRQ
mmetsp:Transcript_22658/g.52889  ORF Transcript_22658/g.52889 Transcript_22658/m.52889 type:complete len:301 (+) Transcript_22658:350-1252(+)